MEIADIKSQLSLAQVLDYYGLKPDKHLKLHCPFHEDKTPSLQVYYKTQSCYCFSASCTTHGKSLDVIDFILYKENCSKHEAIKKAESLITGAVSLTTTPSRTAVLTKLFTYFNNAVHNSKPAQQYLQSRHLDYEKSLMGYNSGQFHHGERKDKSLIESCLKYGLLLDKGHVNNRTGEKAYSPFGKGCVVFPLKNKQGQVVSLYFRSISESTTAKHFYLKDRQGLYPGYPAKTTKKLILTESIIDAATLLQQQVITKDYEVLALYGTNGLTKEHTEAVSQLRELEEMILWLDGDEAGRKAAAKYEPLLQELQPNIEIRIIETPEGEDINSLLDGHSSDIFTDLLHKKVASNPSVEKEKQELNTTNPENLTYQGSEAEYQIKGFNKGQLDSLKVTVQIIAGHKDHRGKCDLYEYKQVSALAKQAAERLQIAKEEIEEDLRRLTNLLEAWRSDTGNKKDHKPHEIQVSASSQTQCLQLLKSDNYFEQLNILIGKSGVIGEESSRLLLYVIASTYKMEETLHALVQGSSGSGKTHLVTKISELMPPEHTIPLTRVTESSFYNYGENELCNRLIILEDLDGLKEEAFLAFRELQSRGMLNSSTSIKNEQGQIKAVVKTVKGPIASLSATTKGEIYEDNMSRCLVIAVDESKAQTERVIHYQNRRAAGGINKQDEQKAIELLRNCMRLIKSYEVINPFADKVQLPEEAHKIRRLNQLYQSFVQQITLLHQYQRKRDKQGRLISEKQDLQLACKILFECIVLKVDELDGPLRGFYEKLKAYVKQKAEQEGKAPSETDFTRIEVRQALKVSKTRQHVYMQELQDFEYIRQVNGYANKGFNYQVNYWDSLSAMRAKIQDQLEEQLSKL